MACGWQEMTLLLIPNAHVLSRGRLKWSGIGPVLSGWGSVPDRASYSVAVSRAKRRLSLITIYKSLLTDGSSSSPWPQQEQRYSSQPQSLWLWVLWGRKRINSVHGQHNVSHVEHSRPLCLHKYIYTYLTYFSLPGSSSLHHLSALWEIPIRLHYGTCTIISTTLMELCVWATHQKSILWTVPRFFPHWIVLLLLLLMGVSPCPLLWRLCN